MPTRMFVPLEEAARRLDESVDALLDRAQDDLGGVELWTIASARPCRWFGTFEAEGRLVRQEVVEAPDPVGRSGGVDRDDAVDRWVTLDSDSVSQLRRDGAVSLERVWQRGHEAVLANPVFIRADQVFLQGVVLERLVSAGERPLSDKGKRNLLRTIGLLTMALVHERNVRQSSARSGTRFSEDLGAFDKPRYLSLSRHLRTMVLNDSGEGPTGMGTSALRARLKEAVDALADLHPAPRAAQRLTFSGCQQPAVFASWHCGQP